MVILESGLNRILSWSILSCRIISQCVLLLMNLTKFSKFSCRSWILYVINSTWQTINIKICFVSTGRCLMIMLLLLKLYKNIEAALKKNSTMIVSDSIKNSTTILLKKNIPLYFRLLEKVPILLTQLLFSIEEMEVKCKKIGRVENQDWESLLASWVSIKIRISSWLLKLNHWKTKCRKLKKNLLLKIVSFKDWKTILMANSIVHGSNSPKIQILTRICSNKTRNCKKRAEFYKEK